MPLHPDILCESEPFKALINNDVSYVKNNFHLYNKLKDYWLTAASYYCDIDINNYFIQQGANPSFGGSENFTNAIVQNNLNLVKFYVSHNCILLQSDDVHLGGAVMEAVHNDNVEMLKYLIELGCNIHLDNDYAFNRGIAENAKNCVKYLVENYQMSYDPFEDYNIEKIISDNSYEILDYIINLIAKPLNFDFSKQINNLFSKGHPEIFDVFVKHNFVTEEKFIENFQAIFYNFTNQTNLYNHLKNNYSDWFDKSQRKNIEENQVKRLLDFVLSQKYNDKNTHLTVQLLEEMQSITFIDDFIKAKPYYFSQVFIEHIENKNNKILFEHTYQPSFIQEKSIQQTLNNKLPQLVDNDYFSDLLKTVFKQDFITELSDLNKIYHYFRLNNSMPNKNKGKLKKI